MQKLQLFLIIPCILFAFAYALPVGQGAAFEEPYKKVYGDPVEFGGAEYETGGGGPYWLGYKPIFRPQGIKRVSEHDINSLLRNTWIG
uniref:Uncharacterized protein n=1 Tax=Rhabditophanes sp. KR3021 TaxID=114890 RepID=A0AC35TWT2_9BILA